LPRYRCLPRLVWRVWNSRRADQLGNTMTEDETVGHVGWAPDYKSEKPKIDFTEEIMKREHSPRVGEIDRLLALLRRAWLKDPGLPLWSLVQRITLAPRDEQFYMTDYRFEELVRRWAQFPPLEDLAAAADD
jgi:hypothetical protein